jgi:putative membrane protein
VKYITLASFAYFLLYAGSGIALLALFTKLYQKWTPYDEFIQMKKGKKAPAFAMGGAMLGFTFPIVSLSYHGVNWVDFIIWSVVAGFVQLVLFKVLYRVIPMDIDEDNQAIGIFYAFAAICVGLINAFSLIPSN